MQTKGVDGIQCAIEKTKSLNFNIGKETKFAIMWKKKVNHLKSDEIWHGVNKMKNQKLKP